MMLIIVRHGETVENSLGICQGQTGGTLSAYGEKQSMLLANELKQYSIDCIYSSTLNRAIQTAQFINEENPASQLLFDARINERYLGDMEGKTFPAGYNWYTDYPQTEPFSEILKRAHSFLEELLTMHANKNIVVVSHGITIVALMAVLTKIADIKMAQSISMVDNASITECELVSLENVKFNKINFTDHLITD